MKHLRKILAAALTLFVAVALATPAFAASLTVTQNPGAAGTAGKESYEAYKIFDVKKTDDQADYTTTAGGPGTAEGFSYTIAANSPWLSTVQGLKDSSNKAYFTLTKSAEGDLYTVTLNDGNNTAAKAKEIAEKLLAAKPSTLSADYTFETGDTTNVADGYYLITSSLGTNLILATSNVEIQEKNEYINDLKIAETASVTVGEKATYYIKVYLPENIDTTKKVTVHDKLDSVLKFQNDVQVCVGNTDPGTTSAEFKALTYAALGDAYTVKYAPAAAQADGCTFEIEITTTGLAGKYLVFKYSAELTSDAVKDTGYVNEEYSTYSNFKTTPSKPEVKTYDFEFTKVDGTTDKNRLDGAKFELYAAWDNTKNEPSGNAIALLANGANYKKADIDDTGTVTEIQVNSKTNNAATNISGLGGADNTNGTNYYLVETEAPAGYNKLSDPIIVNVKDDGTIKVSLSGTQLASASDAFDVVNNTGTVLPSTGGIGTTIFYVVGGVMVAGAIIMIITKRRMASMEK